MNFFLTCVLVFRDKEEGSRGGRRQGKRRGRGRAGRGGGGKKDRTSSCAQIFLVNIIWQIDLP